MQGYRSLACQKRSCPQGTGPLMVEVRAASSLCLHAFAEGALGGMSASILAWCLLLLIQIAGCSMYILFAELKNHRWQSLLLVMLRHLCCLRHITQCCAVLCERMLDYMVEKQSTCSFWAAYSVMHA